MSHRKISKSLIIGLFIVIFIGISASIIANGNALKKTRDNVSHEMTSMKMTNFNKVIVDGNIVVDFKSTETEEVLVYEKLLEEQTINIKLDGKTILIKYHGNNPLSYPTVVINSDKLAHIELLNNAKGQFFEFNGDTLNIMVNHSKIAFKNLSINHANLTMKNEASFSGEPFHGESMQINLTEKSGIWSQNFNVEKINGSIKDNSWVSYNGETPSINIITDKKSRINKY